MANSAASKVVAFPDNGKKSIPRRKKAELFGALDLGTNSCRMLIARPNGDHFDVVDAFSKPVYLGTGLEKTGRLSSASIKRTIDALHVCAKKLSKHGVQKSRLIATASCRQARNGTDFVRRVERETGLTLEIVKPEEEARLAVIGCAAHLKPETEQVLVVDIGGGSTELIWLDLVDVPAHLRRTALMEMRSNLKKSHSGKPTSALKVVDWISVPFGVTTLLDQFSDVTGDKDQFAMMSWYFEEYIAQFGPMGDDDAPEVLPNFQIIGTSGTVTTIASTHLRLKRYDRSAVDGFDMTSAEVEAEIERYLKLGPKGREKEPSIGSSRRSMVMSGSAILQAILRVWPTNTLTIADRGLREGLLYTQMVKSGYLK